MRSAALFVTLILVPLAAAASTVFGSPSSGIVLVDSGEVYVDRVVAVECGTSNEDEFNIAATLEQWDQANFTFDSDDYCSVVAYVRWTPSGSLVGVPVSGFDTLSVQSNAQAVEIELNAAMETAELVQ